MTATLSLCFSFLFTLCLMHSSLYSSLCSAWLCRPGEEPEEPGSETIIPGGVQSVQKGRRKVRDERIDDTNAPSQDTGPGGRLEVQEDSKGVEVDPDLCEVVKGAKHDGKQPRNEGNACDVEMNMSRRDRGPGGHRGKEEASGSVEDDRERYNDGDAIEMDVEWCRTDSAMSGTWRNSK